MRFILFSISLILLLEVTTFAKEPLRTWTSTDGRTLEARYLEMVGSKIRIENSAGKKFSIPMTAFSKDDQNYAKKAFGRELFKVPEPFKNGINGGAIVASAHGRVNLMIKTPDRYSGQPPKVRAVVVGEPIPNGSTLSTGKGSTVDLLLTNGTLAHLGENTKLFFGLLYQEPFKRTNQKVVELDKEVSLSRTALKLDYGQLILDVPKLSRGSSFLIESKIAQAGVRGTKFKVSASKDSSELAVLEGIVDLLDSTQKTTSVTSAKKAEAGKERSAILKTLSATQQTIIDKKLRDCKRSSSSISLARLSDAMEGFAEKPNLKIKSALNMELIWCRPGSFTMGPDNRRKNSPAHKVVLTKGFYLGKFEVTQAQFKEIMGRTKIYPEVMKVGITGPNIPVHNVSWDDAMEFCKKLTRLEKVPQGWGFSLPTEAEWEYACRAGSKSRFSWGDGSIFKTRLANSMHSGHGKPLVVGSYRPNQFGFHDMHGNAAEWCWDWFGGYSKNTQLDPQGPPNGTRKSYRSGWWSADDFKLESRTRLDGPPVGRVMHAGFRVALKRIK